MVVHAAIVALSVASPATLAHAAAAARHVSLPPRPCGIVTARPSVVRERPTVAAAVCPPRPSPVGPRAPFAVGRLVRWGGRRPDARAPEPRRDVTVRTYDAVGLRVDDLRAAQAIVARILQPAGLRVRWVNCSPGERRRPSCARLPQPDELMVRFVRATPKTQGSVLGFAYVPGVLGTVLVDRVQQVADRSGVAPATLFGATLAHELTHLLIGAAIHGTDGLMQAAWDDETIRRAGDRGLALSPDEQDRLRAFARTHASP